MFAQNNIYKMKTNVTMVRKMGDFDVLQRTQDGMFDATSLSKQWKATTGIRKDVGDFIKLESTKEFIKALELNDNVDTQKVVSVSRGGKTQGTWMNPLLFIDFAMWLNPSFKVKVLKFVYDELIRERKIAGDNYIMLSAAGSKLKGYNYVEVAKAMQWIIYNKTGKDLRQHATQEQLTELNDLQSKLAFAIDMGYIKDYTQFLIELRKIYNAKNKKF